MARVVKLGIQRPVTGPLLPDPEPRPVRYTLISVDDHLVEPPETFEGKTDRLEGRIDLDPAAIGDSVTVHLECDLASLDTGSKLRNKHMRENHLETSKFPKAIFDGAAVLTGAGTKLEVGKPVKFEAEGTFTVHGVSRRLRCSAEVTWTGSALAFTATFPIVLPDYQIKRPEILFLKLAETQQLRVSATATPGP